MKILNDTAVEKRTVNYGSIFYLFFVFAINVYVFCFVVANHNVCIASTSMKHFASSLS